MRKIPTLFERDETKKGHPVTDRVKPGCEWVLAGEGVATLKLDGTNVKVEGGQLYKRQKPKQGDYDEASYVPANRDDPSDKYLFEAFDFEGGRWRDGIFEAIGPKIQGNPQGMKYHALRVVVPHDLRLELPDFPRTFDGIRSFLEGQAIEGVVFHHPDGRMAKIKRRDFGLPWPA